MARINKIAVNQVEGRITSDAREPNTYAYNDDGILIRHDNDRVAKRVVGPGVLYGANNDSGDQTGLNTIKLIPNEDINTDQYLVVDPTSPNHIHLRAGGAIDASNSNLILGGENTHVYISDADDQVTLKGSGGQFLNDPTDPDNQIATIGDITGGIGAKHFFSGYSTADQTGSADSIQAFTLTNLDTVRGISLVSNSRITFSRTGTYNIAFSAQFHQTNGSGVVNIWLNKNGTPVANTNTKLAITANNPFSVAAWNFFVDAAPNDYYEIIWSSDSQHTVVEYEAATGSGATLHPAVPSIIITANQVS
ncbi:MAG: hypothetical protein EBS38_01275 [Actinobacteria bacterium]|nr:hypothetical protein [Actinomycetota bacterium]